MGFNQAMATIKARARGIVTQSPFNFSCLHFATPLSTPSGYHHDVPPQSGHLLASTGGVAGESFSSLLPCSICSFDALKSLLRKCSVRNAGTEETVVRAAAILASVRIRSRNSRHCCNEAEFLPITSLSSSRNNPASAASSSINFRSSLSSVLSSPEVV